MPLHYKITSLKGSKNHDIWANEIKWLLTLDKYWLVTISKLPQPEDLSDLHVNTANTTNVASKSSCTTITDKEKENFEMKVQKYKLQIADWDKKHTTACEIMRLNCELEPRVHMKDINLATAFWDILKKYYESTDLATRNKIVSMMIHHSQRNFKIIPE